MKRSLLLWTILSSFALQPAFAGTVYVPVAQSETIEGTTYETRVWASNIGARQRRFSTLLLDENMDGTVRDGLTERFQAVPGQSTILVTDLVDQGERGMLEIFGAPQLQIRAELVARNAQGQVVSNAFMPVISSENFLPGGTIAQLQGLEQSENGNTSSVGMVNLSKESNDCSISIYSNTGTQFGDTFFTTMPPLSQRNFSGVLGSLGQANAAAARAMITCVDEFYAFGTVFKKGPDQIAFLTASEALTSDLSRPGEEPVVPTIEIDGAFFTPVVGDSIRTFELPVTVGVRHSRVLIEYDLTINRFQTPLFHALTNLRRQGGPPLFFAFFIRGSNSRTIIDKGDGSDVSLDGPWSERTTYRVTLDYNASFRQLTVQARLGGEVIYNVTAGVTFSDLSSRAGQPLVIILGQSRVFDNAFFPPWGWTFSNLKVQAFPE